MTGGLELKAYAKINLGLDVLGRRENGYHDVRMIMQTVGICDRIRISRRDDSSVILRCGNSEIPEDSSNLAYRAALLIMKEAGIEEGLDIELEKNIPVAAGMAGGSSDAAAVMHGVNRLFGLGMDIEKLKSIGVGLGADIPYCLTGGTVLAEGIGEKLKVLKDMPDCHLVVAKPDVSVSTGFVYNNLKLEEIDSGKRPDIDRIIEGIDRNSLSEIASGLGNVLETVTENAFPVISKLKEFMLLNGAIGSLMSGSGPTVFGMFNDYTVAKNCCEALKCSSGIEGIQSVHLTGVHSPAGEDCPAETIRR